ncbi:MAG: hypothetical protein QNJ70_26950 [Xenococcaceae cyanobacterium MO_207.B15]|nr:hypothetical protein [Xenococcaceae cyanobacterium MO_207.B15]
MNRYRQNCHDFFFCIEEQDFINSLMVDDENDWSEEDEIKYQRVMRRLQR